VFHLEPVASGFTSPVFVGNAGDGTDRMFVLEKAGVVKVRHAGSGTSTVFLDLRAKVSAYRDAGLLGLAFHPAFEDNGRLFVAYSDLDGHLEFVEFHADGDVADPASERLVLKVEQVPGEIHHAGMLAFGPDGLLYASTGDSAPGGDPERSAQRVDNLLGKILRIDVDGDEPYEVPADNPFVGVDGRDEIWAYGLRNPWRFSFDRGTGDLWIGDVGQDRFEEVDRQPAAFAGGANYGWSLWEGWERYWTDGVAADYVPPVAVYGHDPPCSVTGGYVYRGAAQPWLDGSYLFGDYCTGLVWTLDPDGGGWDMRVALDSSLRITSFGEDEAGEVYVVDYGGAVYRLVAGAPGP
jgi:glucose/arabinose dehydrogenase